MCLSTLVIFCLFFETSFSFCTVYCNCTEIFKKDNTCRVEMLNIIDSIDRRIFMDLIFVKQNKFILLYNLCLLFHFHFLFQMAESILFLIRPIVFHNVEFSYVRAPSIGQNTFRVFYNFHL